jgi:hypothetical protein
MKLHGDRFTPACAGTTFESAFENSHDAVHPRVRGDNKLPFRARADVCGSPPRARGQRLTEVYQILSSRFTPACAGTTVVGRPRRNSFSVHPRVRGDNVSASFRLGGFFGSPLYMRAAESVSRLGYARS